MTITLNGALLKKWWPSLVAAGTAAYHSLSPELTNLAVNHPRIFVYVSAALLFAATLLKSPVAATDPPSTLTDAIAKAKKG